MKICGTCRDTVKLMTPPEIVQGGVFFCSNLCRKVYYGEITEEEREKLANAAVQKSSTSN